MIILKSKDLLGLILLSDILANSRPTLWCSVSGLVISHCELIVLGVIWESVMRLNLSVYSFCLCALLPSAWGATHLGPFYISLA